MRNIKLNDLEAQVKGKILYNEPLAGYTTWKIGGCGDILFLPESKEDLALGVKYAKSHGLPLFIMGNGSNLLVGDGGIRGMIIKIGESMKEMTVDGTTVTIEAGAILGKIARATASLGLEGLEWAAGIPAGIGGAAIMNAGAYGHSFYEVVSAVYIVSDNGEVIKKPVSDLEYSYRMTSLRAEKAVVAAVECQLQQGNKDELLTKVDEILKSRRSKQPLEYPSCGSVFRNPENDYAGRLIEGAGLGGLREGAMEVSQKHANFIINHGGGTAKDTIALIKKVQKEIENRFGVTLETEVCIVGDA